MAERRIETSIEIEASPKKVWSILTDFAGMASWNPFIKSISGALTPGSTATEDGFKAMNVALKQRAEA
jgi:hypothetical protein